MPFFLLLALRLLLRRTAVAVALTMALFAAANAFGGAPNVGWSVAILGAVLSTVPVLVTMRFGLLSGVVSTFVGLVMTSVVASFDLSSWYADRALVPVEILFAMLGYGAATALPESRSWGIRFGTAGRRHDCARTRLVSGRAGVYRTRLSSSNPFGAARLTAATGAAPHIREWRARKSLACAPRTSCRVPARSLGCTKVGMEASCPARAL